MVEERAADRWSWARELPRRLTWRRVGSNRGYMALQGRRGRKGKKREVAGPVWVAKLLDVLSSMGGQWRDEAWRAKQHAKAATRIA